MNFSTVYLLILSLLLLSCSSKPETSSTPLNGKWQLTQALISSGGTAEWTRVENGTIYQFNEEGNFSSDQFPDCSEGEYTLKSGELKLSYTCEGFETSIENEDGWITYKIRYEGDYLQLTPSSIICTEACTYRFTKLRSDKN